MKTMKKYVALIIILLVLATAISCADKTAEDQETTETDNAEPTEEYSPETVDTLTNDFEELQW